MRLSAPRLAWLLLPVLDFASVCHSSHIETTVENRTGAAVNLLEVDYPSASFGADQVAAGGHYHHRIQVRGQGQIKLQYSDGATHQLRQMSGPELFEGQEGRLEIVLLADGKAEFHPALTPAH